MGGDWWDALEAEVAEAVERMERAYPFDYAVADFPLPEWVMYGPLRAARERVPSGCLVLVERATTRCGWLVRVTHPGVWLGGTWYIRGLQLADELAEAVDRILRGEGVSMGRAGATHAVGTYAPEGYALERTDYRDGGAVHVFRGVSGDELVCTVSPHEDEEERLRSWKATVERAAKTIPAPVAVGTPDERASLPPSPPKPSRRRP